MTGSKKFSVTIARMRNQRPIIKRRVSQHRAMIAGKKSKIENIVLGSRMFIAQTRTWIQPCTVITTGGEFRFDIREEDMVNEETFVKLFESQGIPRASIEQFGRTTPHVFDRLQFAERRGMF